MPRFWSRRYRRWVYTRYTGRYGSRTSPYGRSSGGRYSRYGSRSYGRGRSSYGRSYGRSAGRRTMNRGLRRRLA